MNNMRKIESGITEIIVVVVVLLVVVVIGAYFVFFQSDSQLGNFGQRSVDEVGFEEVMLQAEEPVSESDDIVVIEDELESTVVGDVESDFEEFDSDTSQL